LAHEAVPDVIKVVEDTRLDNIPMILETPDNANWAEEIALLKGFVR
jgi:deoxyribonuclease-4